MTLKYVTACAVVFGLVAATSSNLYAQHTGMPGMGDTINKSTTKPKPKARSSTVKKKTKATAKARPKASTAKKPTVVKKAASDTISHHPMTESQMKAMPVAPAAHDTAHHAMPQHADSMAEKAAPMPSMRSDSVMPMSMSGGGAHNMMSGPLGIPMDRMGSGTTWIPDAISLPSRHTSKGAWDIMAHGFVFGQYDKQGGDRGDDQLGSLNWMMLMASRQVAGGHFQARTMLSLDPATVTQKGYPLLLQSGEALHSEPLHDRQHPHDFFMELGALYQREFNKQVAWSIYAAPSGEPALGPVAFMHRPSAMDNPAAPLSHHWQDATHVSFGVITAGVLTKRWQVEGSAFNGREPDENRWNFDPIKLDSYSGRITFNPAANWSLAGGVGYLKSPEALHPEESVHRLTASALHGRKVGTDGQTATALIWGVNRYGGGSNATQSVLLENETILDARNTFFGRTEFVQKTGDDLALDENQSSTKYNIATAQLGYIRELARIHWATVGLGAAGTLNFVPASLEPVYGSRNPLGVFVFIRLRPFHLRAASTMPMGGMKGTDSLKVSPSHE